MIRSNRALSLSFVMKITQSSKYKLGHEILANQLIWPIGLLKSCISFLLRQKILLFLEMQQWKNLNWGCHWNIFQFKNWIFEIKLSPRHWNNGLVSSGVSLTSWGGASLALVGHPSSDGTTIKLPYGVDVLLYRSTSLAHHLFLLGWLKLNLILLLDQLKLA